ncbi:hypothetical protein [Bosea sp. BK604]|uniref:hypothetical protein n=1 Tax=Bosea sp. BK604 TaxID=2512180 RepID=UPI00104F8A3A|nr:hypothetical protein [Bosea sp. BK604]
MLLISVAPAAARSDGVGKSLSLRAKAYQLCVLKGMVSAVVENAPTSGESCGQEMAAYKASLKSGGLSSKEVERRAGVMRAQTDKTARATLLAIGLFGDEFRRYPEH